MDDFDDIWADLGAHDDVGESEPAAPTWRGRTGKLFPRGCLPKLFAAVFGVTLLIAGLVAGVGIIAGRTTANIMTLTADMLMTPVESSEGRRRGEDWPSLSTTTVPTPPSTIISPPITEPQTTSTTVEESRPGPFTLMDVGPDGAPLRWEPCKPIHYVVNAEGAPAGTEGLIESGLESVAAATGFTFVFDGPTTEEWSDSYYGGRRPLYQKDRYGDRFAPVLFDWGTSTQYPVSLSPDAAAIGGPSTVIAPDGARVAVSGIVLFDAESMEEALRAPELAWWPRTVVMHEVGHVLGLGHVSDPTQIMDGRPGGTAEDWGSGDLAGLSILSKGKCYEDGL